MSRFVPCSLFVLACASLVAAPLTAQPKQGHGGVTPSRRTVPAAVKPGSRWPQGGFGLSSFPIQVRENLLDYVGVLDAYMDPSRFARHRFVRDKKKVATIYPACLWKALYLLAPMVICAHPPHHPSGLYAADAGTRF